jgi:hypothetical protein
MPRPNPGPRLVFLEKRQCFYVRWFIRGRERLASMGTADQAKAEKMFSDFLATRTDLYPEKALNLPQGLMGVAIAAADTTYFIGGESGPIKIGATYDVAKRLSSLQCGCPITLSVLATAPGGRPVERAYHQRFAAHRSHREWFTRAPEIMTEIDRLRGENKCDTSDGSADSEFFREDGRTSKPLNG